MTITNVVYVRIDKFNSGSFLIKDRNTVIGTVGPRGSFRDFPKEFSGANKKPSLSWGFKYINANNATFVIAFYKKRKFFPDDHIGEIELKVSDFTPNKVIQREYPLRAYTHRDIPAKVKITVHVDELGAPAFKETKIAQSRPLDYASLTTFSH